ncbi:MAG: hypothetical protein JSR82_17320 [Verrucomicrobia bacterium]|nr:hypothetical protein [Verrucomicrobiota bacterium]
MNAPDRLPGVVDASTFEARYTAWVDGLLPPAEKAAFERELREQHALEADSERQAQEALRSALRTHLAPAPLPNGDFFNHQLMERIRRDAAASEVRGQPAGLPWYRSIFARLSLAGATTLCLGLLGYRALIAPNMEQRPETAYLTRVVNAKSDTPGISAVPLEYKEEGVAVLWLEGMEHLPEAYAVAEEVIEGETVQ